MYFAVVYLNCSYFVKGFDYIFCFLDSHIPFLCKLIKLKMYTQPYSSADHIQRFDGERKFLKSWHKKAGWRRPVAAVLATHTTRSL